MMEEKLERIAVALENIANGLEKLANPMVARGEGAATSAPKAKKGKLAPAPASDDIIPGQDNAAPAVDTEILPEVDASPTVMMCTGIKDTTALRAFTQKALDYAEKESKASNRPQLVNELVTFIKGAVCAKLSPTEPKLAKIPAQHAGAAAQMIYDWCMKNKILIAE